MSDVTSHTLAWMRRLDKRVDDQSKRIDDIDRKLDMILAKLS
jgi:hypothetical protein